MEKYYCTFHEEYFIKTICKHLHFEFISCDVRVNGTVYWLPVFFNTELKKYQIGAVGYGGIFPFPKEFQLFSLILKEASDKLNVNFDKIILPPYFKYDEFNAASLDDYGVSMLSTSVLDLAEYREKGWNIFKGSVRTNIRYAINHNVVVKEAASENEIEDFYSLYTESIKRINGSYLTPIALIKDLMIEKEKVKLYLAYNDKYEVIAGNVLLISNNNVFYWINATSYEHRFLKPNHLIINNFIEKYKDYDYINFGYSHFASLKRFKETLNCKDEAYYILTKKL